MTVPIGVFKYIFWLFWLYSKQTHRGKMQICYLWLATSKSKIIDREGYSSLESNLGIISLILDAEEDGDNLKLIVNTLDDKYIELFFFSVETLVLSV